MNYDNRRISIPGLIGFIIIMTVLVGGWWWAGYDMENRGGYMLMSWIIVGVGIWAAKAVGR